MTTLALIVGLGLAVWTWRTRPTWWAADRLPRPLLAVYGWAIAVLGLSLIGALSIVLGLLAWVACAPITVVLLRWEAAHLNPPIYED